MSEHGEGFGEDVVRVFFRNRVSQYLNSLLLVSSHKQYQLKGLAGLLEEVDKTLKTTINSMSASQDKSHAVLEADQIWLVCYFAAILDTVLTRALE